MKKLLLLLLFIISCVTYRPEKLSIEKVETNANFILNLLNIEFESITCSKDKKINKYICVTNNMEKITTLSCNNDEYFITENKE